MFSVSVHKESTMTTSQAAPQAAPLPNGLEGVVAARTGIGHVFGEEGRLVYRGYEITELAGKASFEEVCYLLWNGKLPTRKELSDLEQKMRAQRKLPEPAVTALRAIPKDADPMAALRTIVSMIGAALPIEGK